MQAKDIPDDAILSRLHPTEWTTWWVFAGAYFPDIPAKVVLAKFRSLHKRKLIDGCPCGCRGDWTVPFPDNRWDPEWQKAREEARIPYHEYSEAYLARHLERLQTSTP